MEIVRNSTRAPVSCSSRRTTTRRISGLPSPVPKKKTTAATARKIVTRLTQATCRNQRNFFSAARLRSFRAFIQQPLHVNARAAVFQPLVRLVVDSLLHQRFLNRVARLFQRRRFLPARLWLAATPRSV